MKRHAWIWVVIVLSAALGVVAMTEMTRHVMRLEQESRAARLRAEHAEKVRLALWRMESEANALLLLENTQPTVGFLQLPVKDQPSYVRQYFELQGSALRCTDEALPDDRASLDGIMKSPSAVAASPLISNCRAVHQVASAWMANGYQFPNANTVAPSEQMAQQIERSKRQEIVERSVNTLKTPNISQTLSIPGSQEPTLIAGNYRPLWLEGELFLVRQVLGAAQPTMQGVWLHKDVMEQRLLGVTRDLFADAKLVALPTGAAVASDHMALVSLPWRLDVSEVLDHSPILHSPAMMALRYAWVGLAVAFVAGTVLILGLVRLSERRAAFVSSVTHELRTPLTTFQLYTELLANGMVRDEAKRQRYYETLHHEAARLGHLVENVLAFAQVERGSARGGVRYIAWHDLWPPILERMKARLAPAGLSLRVVIEPEETDRNLRIDPAALEHILLNLADNAVKYAQPRTKEEVVLTCRCLCKDWEISLRDYGPGIALREQKKIFRSFHKSAQAAAMSKPGVGLGLSLSKRLAKSMDATLVYRDAEGGGACFVLRGSIRGGVSIPSL